MSKKVINLSLHAPKESLMLKENLESLRQLSSPLLACISQTPKSDRSSHTCQQEETQDFTTSNRIRGIKGEDAWFAHVCSSLSASLVWFIYSIPSAEQNISWHTSVGSLARLNILPSSSLEVSENMIVHWQVSLSSLIYPLRLTDILG